MTYDTGCGVEELEFETERGDSSGGGGEPENVDEGAEDKSS